MFISSRTSTSSSSSVYPGGQDKTEKTERFLEGTEVSKDEIVSLSHQIPNKETGPHSQGLTDGGVTRR